MKQQMLEKENAQLKTEIARLERLVEVMQKRNHTIAMSLQEVNEMARVEQVKAAQMMMVEEDRGVPA